MAHRLCRRDQRSLAAIPSTFPATVVALPRPCYRCGRPILVIAGAIAAHRFFLFIDEIARDLVEQLDSEALARQGIGPIVTRRSRTRPEGYLANGCVYCDAIQGSFPLREELIEFEAEGGYLPELPAVGIVELPVTALDEAESL